MSLLSSIRERISSSFERWRNRRQEEKERKRIERERRLEQQRREEEKRKFLYRLGNDFEDYVITMFNPEKFELIHRTPTNDDTNGRFVHSMVYPDLRFREIATGRKFWVEVKFGHISSLSAEGLAQAKLPVVSMEEQERIADLLDSFDAYCNDLTGGIPAEIEARKKQYEYYRDKLLTLN